MAMSQDSSEISNVLSLMSSWTPEMKRDLATHLLRSLERPEISVPPKTMKLDTVVGILRTSERVPDAMRRTP